MAFRNDTVFIDAPLTESDVKPLEEFASKYNNDLGNMLPTIMNMGYTFKAGWYPDNEAFTVFLMPTKQNRSNNKKILTARSDDIIEAFFMVAYKHIVVFNSDEWLVNKSSKSWG